MKTASSLLLALTFAVPLTACPAADDTNDDGAGTGGTGNGPGGTGADDTPDSTAGDDAADDAADDAPGTSAGDDAADDAADDGGGMACMHTCSGDGDCTIAGTDAGLICQDSVCVNGNPCTDDTACVAQLSGWSFSPCTMGGGECDATMQVCVDLGDGTGGCATPPSEFVTCDVLMQSEVMQTSLDDGSEVTVCGNTSGVCDTDTGYCSIPCVDDTTCGTSVCNVETGVCQCDSDDDCGEEGTCNVADGTCSVPGCMEDADCENPFDGGTISCG